MTDRARACPDCRRIWLIGPPGAGKSSLGRTLGGLTGVPHIELDGLYWRPHWAQAGERDFQAAVTRVVEAAEWIVDGQYDVAHALLLDHAELVIWLDTNAMLAFGRLLRRTVRRLVSREELWNGNKERPRGALTLLAWSLGEYRRVRKRNLALSAQLDLRQTPWVRVRGSAELEELVAALAIAPPG